MNFSNHPGKLFSTRFKLCFLLITSLLGFSGQGCAAKIQTSEMNDQAESPYRPVYFQKESQQAISLSKAYSG
jgi:hypothetical protein